MAAIFFWDAQKMGCFSAADAVPESRSLSSLS